ncbi:MAG: tryptophan synthase subunit alpha, partial [Pseudomonadales bacterium]
MNRIQATLDKLAADKRKALVSYIVAGDPDLSYTVPQMHQLVKSGTDIIELGVPFSDPSAEGPTIQRAHERAL